MKVNKKSYPHPVLGNGDDIDGLFRAVLHHELGRDNVAITTDFEIENETIEDLVKKGSALFVLEVECPSSFFRKSYSSGEYKKSMQIPARLLRNQVDVGFYVVSAKKIDGYRPLGAHPDYEGIPFTVE